MTATQVIALGVRLFSVWLFVYVVRNVPGMWQYNSLEADSSANLVVAIVACVLFAVVAVLWLFPLTVANKLLPQTLHEDRINLPLEQVQAVGFSLIGLWVLTNAIPSALYWVLMSYYGAKPNSLLHLSAKEYSLIASTVLELVLGIWLLFGAKGLLGILRRACSAGA
jgi:hypothetical protein